MKIVWLLLAEVILFFPSRSDSKYHHIVYIDPSRGSNSQECLVSNAAASSCQTLDWVLNQPKARRNSTSLILSGGYHNIENSFPALHSLNELEFRGSNSTLRCLLLGLGLAFVESQDIKMHDLTVCNCSLLLPASINIDPDGLQLQAALLMLMCRNVVLENIHIYDTLNGTSLVMYHVSGEVGIMKSKFGTTYSNGNLVYSSGLLIFTSQNDSCTTKNSSLTSHCLQGSSYILQNVTFYNNSATDPRHSTFKTQKMCQSYVGRGGGFALIINENCSNHKFLLKNCTFLSNQAFQGSGMYIDIHSSSRNNSVYIDNCLFADNKVNEATKYQSIGGGLSLKYLALPREQDYSKIPKTMVVVTKCNFTNNEAFNGGAIAISSLVATEELIEERLNVRVENSTFSMNRAKLGAAIKVACFCLAGDVQHLAIEIANSIFITNSVLLYSEWNVSHEKGVGVVYSSNVPLSIVGNNVFSYNNGSALAVVGSWVDFRDCSVLFTGNTGTNGGAVNMLGSAYLLVNNNTDLKFVQNRAQFHGGAIANVFTEQQNSKVYPNCFIRHRDPFTHPNQWNAKFTFIANKAAIAGDSIFTTSILPCSWAGGTGKQELSEVFHWKGWEYHQVDDSIIKDGVEVSTAAGHIQLIANGSESVASVPGKKFILPLQTTDDLFQSTVAISTLFVVRLVQTSGVNASSKDTFMTASESLELSGSENSNTQVLLESLGQRSWLANFNVSLKPCPPGYGLDINTSKCVCQYFNYGSKIQCVDEKFKCKLRYGYWLGITKRGIEISTCPPSFCKLHKHKNEQYFLMPQQYDNLSNALCSEHREGIICGKCKKGYGVSVTTGQLICIPCKDSQLATNIVMYWFMTFIPLVAFFILLALLKIRISNGVMNSFTFYMQAIFTAIGSTPGNSSIYLTLYIEKRLKLWKLYRIAHGVFNFRIVENFFHPICLHRQLNSLDVFQLDYVVIFLPLFFVGVVAAIFGVIKITRDRFCFKSCKGKSFFKLMKRWSIGESVMHALALYWLVAYSRLVLSSCHILEWNTTFKFRYKYSPRAFYAGQYLTSDVEYKWRYAAPAYFILAILFMFAIVLLCPLGKMGQCCIKLKWMSKCYFIKQFCQLFDIYRGCFKVNRKYFAGIYFLLRIVFGAVFLSDSGIFHRFSLHLSIYILLIMLLGLLQPYRTELRHMNIIDILMFINLAIVTGISFYVWSFNVFYDRNRFGPSVHLRSSQLLLAYTPLVIMLVYLVWRSLPATSTKYLQKQLHGLTSKLTKWKGQFLGKFFHLHYEVSNVANDDDNLLASINRIADNFESSQETPTGEASSAAAIAEMTTCHNETSSLLDSNKPRALNKRPASYGLL